MIGMKTAGWSTRRVAGQVDRSECAVRNCWEQWTREGTHARKTGSGATRKNTSDESRFVLGIEDNRVRVWMRPGQRYVDDILRPHVGPFLNGLPGETFQQDSARPHTTRVAQDFLRHIQSLPWPARSSNLSPVQHGGDQLKRHMPSCHSVHDLELAVQDLWALCLRTT
ncbi:uncharacterized protein TNCV_472931 [Trichonephila clavipes]|nr:uncharacterized protein TNCV_472931 [Trichonephila clavipes]